jgi:hypothetical protein
VNTTEEQPSAQPLAGVGLDFDDVPEACQATVRITGSTKPGDATQAYQDYYPLTSRFTRRCRLNFNQLQSVRTATLKWVTKMKFQSKPIVCLGILVVMWSAVQLRKFQLPAGLCL